MRIAKVLSAFVGVLVVIGSLGVLGAGAVALSVDHADGYLTAGPVRITADSAAVVSGGLDLFGNYPAVDRLDFDRVGARIEADSRNGKAVFVGIGPVDDVNRYVAGVRHASVEFFGDEVVVVGHDGTSRIPPPADESFWAAEATDEQLTWRIENGRWAMALLNADGTPGIDVDLTAGARVPFVRPIGIAFLVAGLVGLAVGVALTYLGVRTGPSPAATPSEAREESPVG